jgi:hypothetical protein
MTHLVRATLMTIPRHVSTLPNPPTQMVLTESPLSIHPRNNTMLLPRWPSQWHQACLATTPSRRT